MCKTAKRILKENNQAKLFVISLTIFTATNLLHNLTTGFSAGSSYRL